MGTLIPTGVGGCDRRSGSRCVGGSHRRGMPPAGCRSSRTPSRTCRTTPGAVAGSRAARTRRGRDETPGTCGCAASASLRNLDVRAQLDDAGRGIAASGAEAMPVHDQIAVLVLLGSGRFRRSGHHRWNRPNRRLRRTDQFRGRCRDRARRDDRELGEQRLARAFAGPLRKRAAGRDDAIEVLAGVPARELVPARGTARTAPPATRRPRASPPRRRPSAPKSHRPSSRSATELRREARNPSGLPVHDETPDVGVVPARARNAAARCSSRWIRFQPIPKGYSFATWTSWGTPCLWIRPSP